MNVLVRAMIFGGRDAVVAESNYFNQGSLTMGNEKEIMDHCHQYTTNYETSNKISEFLRNKDFDSIKNILSDINLNVNEFNFILDDYILIIPLLSEHPTFDHKWFIKWYELRKGGFLPEYEDRIAEVYNEYITKRLATGLNKDFKCICSTTNLMRYGCKCGGK